MPVSSVSVNLAFLVELILGVMPGNVTVEGAWRDLRGHRLERGSVLLARAADGSAASWETVDFGDWFGYSNAQRRSYRTMELSSGHLLTSNSDAVTYRYKYYPPPLPAQAVGDPDCAEAVRRFDRSPGAPESSGRMLGYRTVTYRFRRAAVTFAPDLGCPLLHLAAYTAGEWGLPERVETWEVTAIRHGVPDAKWFAPVGRLEDRPGDPYCAY